MRPLIILVLILTFGTTNNCRAQSIRLEPLSKNVLHDTNTVMSYYALYCNSQNTHPVDIKARALIDSLESIGIDTILFYRDWIGTNGYNGYGKLIWRQGRFDLEYQINFNLDHRYRDDIFIESSKSDTNEALNFYLNKRVDTVRTKPEQGLIQMSHDASHFIFSSINQTENCFYVRGLDQKYDSSHLKSQLINKLIIKSRDYFKMLEQRRDSLLPDYDISIDWLNINFSSGSTATYPVVIRNYSKDTLRYHSMSCSWSDFYQTDNPLVEVQMNLCGKNVPKTITIAPNENDTVFLALQSKDLVKQEFKIGFKLLIVKDIRDIGTFRIQEESKNAEVLWSEIID